MLKTVKIKNEIVFKKMKVADGFLGRMIGLMFKKDHPEMDALLISPCNSIHTFFMKYSIDVIFLDRENKIVKVIKNIKPWRMTLLYFKATKVLEYRSGLHKVEFKIGDHVDFV